MEAFKLIHQNSLAILNDEEYGSTEEAYTRSLVDILEEYNEVDGVTVSHYSVMSSGGKEIAKINGFSVNDEAEDYQISLFIIKHSEDIDSIGTIPTNDVNSLKNKIVRYLKLSIEGKYESIQEHSTIFQLSKDIESKANKISKVDIYILTNLKFPKIEKLIGHDQLDNIDLNFHYWDINRFEKLITSNLERSSIDIDFHEYNGSALNAIKIDKNKNYSCLLTVFNGEMLANLYRDFDTKLLESNVRVFLQQTGKVNKGIRDTIRLKPEMFLPYNNGISATCENVDFENGKLNKVYDLQIVNGGQTTASLYYTKKKFNSSLENVDVQVKITIIPNKEIKDDEVPKISEYANTQNKVTQLDLKSNHPYLVKIEEYSRKISFNDPVNHNLSHYWFFERVNGAYREALSKESTPSRKKVFRSLNPSAYKFKKPDVARWINLFDHQPHVVSQGAQKSFLALINDHANEHVMSVDKSYYLSLIGKGILFKWFDNSFGRHNSNPIGDTNVKSYTVNYTLSLLSIHIGKRLDYVKISNLQYIDDSLYENTRVLLKQTYDYLVKKSNGGLISEVSKKKDTWDDFKHIKPLVNHKEMFKKYLLLDENVSLESNDPNEYIITLYSIVSKGSSYWDALNTFAKPENSRDILTVHEKQLIEKGYNYFFRMKGKISYPLLQSINNLIEDVESRFDIDEIKKLSNRHDKNCPDLIMVHQKLVELKEEDLLKILNSRKIQNSKAKRTYINALKSINLLDLNYEDLSLEDIRYLGWAIGVK